MRALHEPAATPVPPGALAAGFYTGAVEVRMHPARLLPLPLVLGGLALLAGCGGTARTGDQPGPAATPAAPRATAEDLSEIHDSAVVTAEQPEWSAATSTLPIPLPTDGDLPQDYWSEIARSLAAKDVGTSAPTSGALLAPPPGAAGSTTASTAATAESGGQGGAGMLLVPAELRPGVIHLGADRYLLALPVAFQPEMGFARPLHAFVIHLRLAGSGSILDIPGIGFSGLRHGPLPLPSGREQFYFREIDLASRLAVATPAAEATWRLDRGTASAAPTHAILYGVLTLPAGARAVDAVVEAQLRFTTGPEATVQAPLAHVHIDLGARGPGGA